MKLTPTTLFKATCYLGIIAFFIPLGGYMLMGTYMRYSGDDYCYASVLKEHGFIKMHWVSYSTGMPYNGNRYSLTLFSAVGDLFGPLSSAVMPTLAILLWLGGIYILLRRFAQSTDSNAPGYTQFLISQVIVFLTLYQAPSIHQTLYWRSGMLPYLAPLVLSPFLAVIIIDTKTPTLTYLVKTFGTAFLAAGFSEIGATFYLSAVLIFIIAGATLNRNLHRGAIPALLGTCAGLLALYISPSNRSRLITLSPNPDILSIIVKGIDYSWDFISESLQAVILPSIFTIVFFGLFTAICQEMGILNFRKPIKLGYLAGAGIGSTAISFAIIASTMLPSIYIQSAYPELRGLLPARFVMVLWLASLGVIIGLGARPILTRFKYDPRMYRIALLLCLVILLSYPLRSTRSILAQQAFFSKWARLWDERQAFIQSARDQGAADIEVMILDHPIPNVTELNAGSHWYNQCAARYYGVHQIRATLPGWDD